MKRQEQKLRLRDFKATHSDDPLFVHKGDEIIDDVSKVCFGWVHLSKRAWAHIDGGTMPYKTGDVWEGLRLSIHAPSGKKKVEGFSHEWKLSREERISSLDELVDVDALLRNVIALDSVYARLPKTAILKKDREATATLLYQADLLKTNLQAIVAKEAAPIAPELIVGAKALETAVAEAIKYGKAKDSEMLADAEPVYDL